VASRDTGRKNFALTYESAMTRLFKDGRTETIRSLSDASCAFVRCMEDPKCTAEARRQALLAASNYHQTTSRKAMTGGGVDRHLFGLYVACMALGLEAPFLKVGVEWSL
jgi:carnitine O-palmitoyltransferase 1, liver isoform